MEEWRAVSRVLKSPGQIVRALFDDLETTFFPVDCRVCGGPLTDAGPSLLCDAPVNDLREQTGVLCVCRGEAGLNWSGEGMGAKVVWLKEGWLQVGTEGRRQAPDEITRR